MHPSHAQARIDFEKHFARVTSPSRTTAMGTTMAKVDEAINGLSSERMKVFVQTHAFENDVASLQVILDSATDGDPWMDSLLDWDDRIAVIYSVAHMLVDGSGNEHFAEKWMAVFGHTSELAAEYFRDLWSRPVDTLVHEQIRLSVAALADIFDLETFADRAKTPIEAAWIEPRNKNVFEVQARELAYLFRLKYPNHLPDIEIDDENGRAEMVPLAGLLMCERLGMGTHLLPAVSMAYDSDNLSVKTAMRDGIDKMLSSRKLSIESQEGEGFQWQAMQNWGDEGLGKRVWNAAMQANNTFISAIAQITGDSIYTRLAQVEALGADLQAPCNPGAMSYEQEMRLLDAAVNMRNDGLVGYLLAKGCDPELESINRGTNQVFSAASLALAADPNDPDVAASAATEKIQSMIRAHLAKKTALEVIDELTPAPAAGSKP